MSNILKWLFEGDIWWALFGGAYLGLFAFLILAIDRYLGYAKGTSARQSERYLKTQETLKAQREEALLKARSSSEIQKAGATSETRG